jgi:hypothetical protein
MVSANGSPAVCGAVSTPRTAAGVEAQLERYKKELSNCVNCESAKTASGKAAIEAAASKISTAEARIEKITTDKQTVPPAAPSPAAADKRLAAADAVRAAEESKSRFDAASDPRASAWTTGSRVDIFA